MSIPMLSQTGQVWDPQSIMISGQGFIRYVGSAEHTRVSDGRRQWERPVRARSVSDSVALIIDQSQSSCPNGIGIFEADLSIVVYKV